MDVGAMLKGMFPKPKIPQKRYLLLAMLLYLLAKLYVSATPDPSDDKWPDMIKGAVVEMYTQSGDDGLQFGEGA